MEYGAGYGVSNIPPDQFHEGDFEQNREALSDLIPYSLQIITQTMPDGFQCT